MGDPWHIGLKSWNLFVQMIISNQKMIIGAYDLGPKHLLEFETEDLFDLVSLILLFLVMSIYPDIK